MTDEPRPDASVSVTIPRKVSIGILAAFLVNIGVLLWNTFGTLYKVDANSEWIADNRDLSRDVEKFKLEVGYELKAILSNIEDINEAVDENTNVTRQLKDSITDMRIDQVNK